jgi:hypothetical protein
MPSIEANRTYRSDLLAYLHTGHHPDAGHFARKYNHNHNHDPKNGEFTFAPGGGGSGRSSASGSGRQIAPSPLRDLVAKPVAAPPRVQLAAGKSGSGRSTGRATENRLIPNSAGETNSFLMGTANARISAIAPRSPALEQLSAPGVPPESSVVRRQLETADYLEGVHGILKPNGTNYLGRAFTSSRNRNVYGGAAEFDRLADGLTRGATLDPNSSGRMTRFLTPGGGNITLRTGLAASPNTPQIYGVIDINIPGMTHRHFAIKVHK